MGDAGGLQYLSIHGAGDCPLDRQVAVRTALENRVEYATELPVQSDELLSKTMRGEISFS